MLAIEETPTESDSGELIAAALEPDDETPQLTEPELSIFHGESVTDRRSTFQAHVVEVHSVNEVLQSNVNEMIVLRAGSSREGCRFLYNLTRWF